MPYLRGCQPASELAASVPRVDLPDGDDWRWDAAGGPADPQITEHALAHVEAEGWTIVGSYVQAYIYSVGLTRRGWPELVMRINQLSAETAGAVLCEVVAGSENDQVDPSDGRARSITGFRLGLTAIADRLVSRVCPVAFALYGTVRAVEVVVGDDVN